MTIEIRAVRWPMVFEARLGFLFLKLGQREWALANERHRLDTGKGWMLLTGKGC